MGQARPADLDLPPVSGSAKSVVGEEGPGELEGGMGDDDTAAPNREVDAGIEDN
jgi:hypothetical protein